MPKPKNKQPPKQKSTWGGKRNGAGRPLGSTNKTGPALVPLSVQITKEQDAWLRAQLTRRQSLGSVVRAALERLMDMEQITAPWGQS